MKQLWNIQKNFLEIKKMPYYWRLSNSIKDSSIPKYLPIRVRINDEYDFLESFPTDNEWKYMQESYFKNENIGFVNPESGQILKYGKNVNDFFLKVMKNYKPKTIFEIGCGAGFTIKFLSENGFNVIGIDPSEYSFKWSQKLNFELINNFFDQNTIEKRADFIFCNDVFEHIPKVYEFTSQVYDSLNSGGVFCFSTPNSTQNINIGDISMFEHQHVNMFSENSIKLILQKAGFNKVVVNYGKYGNVFNVIAEKTKRSCTKKKKNLKGICRNFFERTSLNLNKFEKFYKNFGDNCCFYVPLRCIPYLALVGDFGKSDLFDSNQSWRGKYIDGYSKPIKSKNDLKDKWIIEKNFFIGSITFYKEIKKMLIDHKVNSNKIFSIYNL